MSQQVKVTHTWKSWKFFLVPFSCLLKSLVLVSQILGGASEKQAGRVRHKLSQEDRGSLLHLLLGKKAQSCQAVKAARQTEKEKGAESGCH